MSTILTINDRFLDGKPRALDILKVEPRQILHRLLSSFYPPNLKTNRFEVDLIGPILILVTLCGLLHYTASLRKSNFSLSPSEALLIFAAVVPFITFLLLKASGTSVTYWQVVSLLGYALFSHIVTLCLTLLFRTQRSHAVFLIVFTVLGGLSCVRLVIIFTLATQRPAIKLLGSCFACICHLLLLLFSYFAYIPLY